jgi:hypothetical protein
VSRGRRLTAGYAAGGALVAVGAYAFFGTGTRTQWRSAATWFAGGVLAHDLLLAPAAVLVGAGLARAVPSAYRGVVQAALYVSGTVALAAVVLVSGKGRDPTVPSQQPLPYGRNLLVVLALIWTVAAFVVAVRVVRARRARTPRAGPRPSR